MVEGEPGTYGAVADIIPASNHVRGDFSVAYNSAANRITALFLNTTTLNVEMFQSPTLTATWTLVPGSTTKLPNNTTAPALYAPLMDELYMTGAGQGVNFLRVGSGSAIRGARGPFSSLGLSRGERCVTRALSNWRPLGRRLSWHVAIGQ
jgi:hypothetical protein